MFLTREEKKNLINRFPTLELSYEIVLHKKVSADMCIIIPCGQKAFVWFTYWKEKNTCFILFLNNNNNICDVKEYPTCFDSKLSLNTVIHGTVFKNNNLLHFSCEELFYYKGSSLINHTFLEKMIIFKDMFDYEIKQIAYTSDFLILGLPIIKTTYEKALACINGLSYKVYGIQSQNNNKVVGINKVYNPKLPEAIFKVSPLLGEDIYKLNCNDRDIPYGIAFIPSYKCSVMMNAIFRNIKENKNLDLLEESDDDDEYENTNINKYVNLKFSTNMRCVYIKKFKKWQPIEVIDNKNKVSSYREIQSLEK